MFQWTEEELAPLGAQITTREIAQQPRLWNEAFAIFKNCENDLGDFLQSFTDEVDGKIRVIFTGAGTSAYVGDVVKPHLNRYGDTDHYTFEAISTTDIVSSPYDCFVREQPTLLVSFARSGNSPESVATIDLANQVLNNVRHLIITCAPEGKLAKNSQEDPKSFVILMPPDSNDQGFAMTGSFTCMTLTALLAFDCVNTDHQAMVNSIVAMGNQALAMEEEIQTIVDQDFDRVVYLGSGSLSGLTREAQLKLLELTAGQIATAFDSSLGFRHGPKSFVDAKTLIFNFVSNDPYTRQYDIDILEEIKGNEIAVKTIGIVENGCSYSGETIFLTNELMVPDAYLALPYIIVAQTVALLTSIKVKNKPDTPSPTGTVNRVVQGVIIHEL